MSHILLLILSAATCLGLFYLGIRLARAGDWLYGWLHGCAVMASFVFAFFMLAIAYTMMRFESIDDAQSLASVSVSAVDQNNFFVEIANSGGDSWYTSLEGDGWQLYARGVRFSGALGALFHRPAARLHEVSNRFYDFGRRDELRRVRVAPSQLESFLAASGFDIWQMAQSVFQILRPLGFEPQGIHSEVLPLVDGALYSVHWRRTHLEVRPGNEIARLSLSPDSGDQPQGSIGAAQAGAQAPAAQAQ